jgi:hypothetical protein
MRSERGAMSDPTHDPSGVAKDRLTSSDLAAGHTDRSKDVTDQTERGPGTEQGDDDREALLSSGEGAEFQERWEAIQVRFVDEPKTAVQEADSLVVELMQQLASTFADERGRLEGEWERGADVSTEDLRQALRHYRSFFNRLLAA